MPSEWVRSGVGALAEAEDAALEQGGFDLQPVWFLILGMGFKCWRC